jgi:hypothetical protein
MPVEAAIPNFRCASCGSDSIVIEAGPFRPTSQVKCHGCGRALGGWKVFDEEHTGLPHTQHHVRRQRPSAVSPLSQ